MAEQIPERTPYRIQKDQVAVWFLDIFEQEMTAYYRSIYPEGAIPAPLFWIAWQKEDVLLAVFPKNLGKPGEDSLWLAKLDFDLIWESLESIRQSYLKAEIPESLKEYDEMMMAAYFIQPSREPLLSFNPLYRETMEESALQTLMDFAGEKIFAFQQTMGEVMQQAQEKAKLEGVSVEEMQMYCEKLGFSDTDTRKQLRRLKRVLKS